MTTRQLGRWTTLFTFTWLIVYAPLETYVTWSIGGAGGLLHSAYILDVAGMGLMLWGALATSRGAPAGSTILAVGWSWTAAVFWRATADRFWWSSLGHSLYFGPSELWLAPAITAVAVGGFVASLVLAIRHTRGDR